MKYELSSKQRRLLTQTLRSSIDDFHRAIECCEERQIEHDWPGRAEHIADMRGKCDELAEIIEIIKPVSRKGKQ